MPLSDSVLSSVSLNTPIYAIAIYAIAEVIFIVKIYPIF